MAEPFVCCFISVYRPFTGFARRVARVHRLVGLGKLQVAVAGRGSRHCHTARARFSGISGDTRSPNAVGVCRHPLSHRLRGSLQLDEEKFDGGPLSDWADVDGCDRNRHRSRDAHRPPGRLRVFAFVPRLLLWLGVVEADESIRSTGTSGNANLAAGLLVCLALVCFYKIVAAGRSLKQRLFWAGIFAVYALGFDLTGTRMAWIALGAGMAVQLWFFLYGSFFKHWLKSFHFSHVLLLIALPGLLLLLGKEWLPREASFDTACFCGCKYGSGRWTSFYDNWLFGVLPLHFGEVFMEYFGQYEYHAHNLWIGIAVDFGLIGFTLFTLLLVTGLIRGDTVDSLGKQPSRERVGHCAHVSRHGLSRPGSGRLHDSRPSDGVAVPSLPRLYSHPLDAARAFEATENRKAEAIPLSACRSLSPRPGGGFLLVPK